MDLQTGNLYWQTTMPDAPAYPSVKENIECDVLIIGGGSSGAQCAYYLSQSDLDIVVVDKRKVGYGSTCSNTALIQYLGEKMFFNLINTFGELPAVRHLKLCKQAINEIEKACNSLNIDTEFVRRDSLYYASYKEDIPKLKKEYEYLKKYDFKIDFLDENKIKKLYPFKKYAALYTMEDAELNPYKFTIGLLEEAKNRGIKIYEQTEIKSKKTDKKITTVFTKDGYEIKAKYIIIAAGYECLEFKVEKNTSLISSYATITNQVKDFSSWYKRTLIWETARPYIYMRTTADNRIIIGGLDENITYPNKRDSKLINKKNKLIEEFNKLFPNIKVYPEFYLSAFYGGTHDGLPIIGIYDEFPNCFFLYAYGDNGTVYSMVLAKIINDLIIKGSNPNLDIYLQTRPILSLK